MIKASFGISDSGAVRGENQDAFLLDTARGVFAVADGLGGLAHGELASRTAIELLGKKLARNGRLSLKEVVQEVNAEARKAGLRLDAGGFGTTLTVARHHPGSRSVDLAHVGDSAAWLVRDGKARLLTVEHTVAARMAAALAIDSESGIIPDLARHTLTQCIGQEPHVDPQVLELPVQPGDRLFLMTDGVCKPLPEETLRQALEQPGPLDRVCQNLTFRVELAGAPDNYTIVALEF